MCTHIVHKTHKTHITHILSKPSITHFSMTPAILYYSRPEVRVRRLFFDRATRTPTLTMETLSAVPQNISLMPEELVLIKLDLSTPAPPAETAWYKQVETVETYQSTQTVSTLGHTRPENKLPFSTLPSNVSGMVTARISLGGLNETLSAALASLKV